MSPNADCQEYYTFGESTWATWLHRCMCRWWIFPSGSHEFSSNRHPVGNIFEFSYILYTYDTMWLSISTWDYVNYNTLWLRVARWGYQSFATARGIKNGAFYIRFLGLIESLHVLEVFFLNFVWCKSKYGLLYTTPEKYPIYIYRCIIYHDISWYLYIMCVCVIYSP